jgi:D-xylose transport system substrate-binding protein
MTVYKAVKAEANAAAAAAVHLIQGTPVQSTGTTRDDTGNRDVKSILLMPQAITADKVKDVVTDGFVTAAEVCTADFLKYCTQYGVS